MSQQSIIIVAVIVVIGGVVAASYYSRSKSSTISSLDISPVTSMTPVASPASSPLAVNETSPPAQDSLRAPSVEGTHTPTSPSPTHRPSPAPRAVISVEPSSSSNSTRIVFVDLPREVRAGEQFTIRWRVEGPPGTQGEETSLKVTSSSDTSNNRSHSSSSLNSSQSFGSFTVPQSFSGNFSLNGTGSTVHAVVTARVNGQALTAEQDIQIVN
jgi:hypothetical protein